MKCPCCGKESKEVENKIQKEIQIVNNILPKNFQHGIAFECDNPKCSSFKNKGLFGILN